MIGPTNRPIIPFESVPPVPPTMIKSIGVFRPRVKMIGLRTLSTMFTGTMQAVKISAVDHHQ